MKRNAPSPVSGGISRPNTSIPIRVQQQVIGVIALPNPQSVALHRAMGFTEVGVLKRVGYKFGRYIDVGLWQMSVA